jgi:hypothetical protein
VQGEEKACKQKIKESRVGGRCSQYRVNNETIDHVIG